MNELSFDIKSLSRKYSSAIAQHIDSKTKPLGALGQIEVLAKQLADIQSEVSGDWSRINIAQPTAIVFAGDHGIARHGVSIAPSEVTQQMVLNFLAGGAAINCFCQTNDITLHVVDCGIKVAVPADIANQHKHFHQQRIAAGTQDFSCQSAMTLEQANQAIESGALLCQRLIEQGADLLLFGEMGIGNTSAASALLSLFTGLEVDQCVGLGTGITEEQLAKKKALIGQGVTRVRQLGSLSVEQKLAQVGGFEIAQIIGATLAAAQASLPIVVDGFIVSVAIYIATRINPNVEDYLIFAHQSQEFAHQHLLQHLAANPLLNLNLRLGEGTGAALAVPLIRAAAAFYNDMASFESAGVTV